jgi:GcrA cell cycle regulator
MSDAFDWNDVTTRKVRDLWAEGHSTAEIGRRMGVSKNAVVGKAHRLDLPARSSPIRKGGHQAVIAPKRAPRLKRVQTLPSLAAAVVPAPVTTPDTVSPTGTARDDTAPVPARRPTTRCDGSPCCWPIGKPGQPGFGFCDAPITTRAPYCEAHARKAYVRASSRRREGSEAVHNDW